MKGKKGAAVDDGADEAAVVRGAKKVGMPGDGSCLFHSLAYGLKGTGAGPLRTAILDFMVQHPEELVAGAKISDWVMWDSNTSVSAYVASMRSTSAWGGAIEIAVCSMVRRCTVHVYEGAGGNKHRRIPSFGNPDAGAPVVNVVYGGRVHYDALVIR